MKFLFIFIAHLNLLFIVQQLSNTDFCFNDVNGLKLELKILSTLSVNLIFDLLSSNSISAIFFSRKLTGAAGENDYPYKGQ